MSGRRDRRAPTAVAGGNPFVGPDQPFGHRVFVIDEALHLDARFGFQNDNIDSLLAELVGKGAAAGAGADDDDNRVIVVVVGYGGNLAV